MKKNTVELHNVDVEKVLLSSVLLKQDALTESLDKLQPGDFYNMHNAEIFRTIAQAKERGFTPDMPLIHSMLKERGAGDNVFHALVDLSGIPASVNYSEMIKTVFENSRKRDLLNKIQLIQESIFKPSNSSDKILSDLNLIVKDLSLNRSNNNSSMIDAAALLNMEFPAPEFLVNGIIQKGNTGIMAPPKGGKSWAVLDLMVSLSLGQPFMGVETKKLKTVYLALEDNDIRLQNRIKKQNIGKLIPGQCALTTQWKTGAEGFLQLHNYIQAEKPDVIGIDTLGVFSRMRDGNDYSEATSLMSGFKNLSHENNVSLIIVHHTRKAQAGGSDSDFLERTLGSQGIAGGLDSVIHISRKRNSEDATLSITGRDIEEQELAIRFNKSNCRWEMLGKSYEVADSAQRQEILDLLKAEPGLTPSEIADNLNKNKSTTRVLLKKMVETGHIRKQEISGRYKINDDKF